MTPDSRPTPSIAHLPVSLFASVMGIGGLAVAWRRAADVFRVSSDIGKALTWVAFGVFGVVAAAYAVKLVRAPRAVATEWSHPVKMAFVPTIPIGMLVVAAALMPEHPHVAEWLWWTGAVGQLIATVAIVRAWIGNPKFRPGPHSACLLLDCGRLDWRAEDIVAEIDRGTYTYADLVRELVLLEPGELGTTIPKEWNHLEVYEPGVTRCTHFTVVSDQPWKVDGNPLDDVWTTAFREALAAGAVDPDDVIRGIIDEELKPSLAAHLAVAPGVSDAVIDAVTALGYHRAREQQLERTNQAMLDSSSWKVGSTLTRSLTAPRAWLRRS